MKVTILAVGRNKEKYLIDGIAEFQKRLRPLLRVEITEVADEKITEGMSAADELKLKEREGERILAAIPSDSYVVALDVNGKLFSSEDLAAFFDAAALRGEKNIIFIIGGATGLAESVLKRADLRLSFSRMTFTHQMIRLLLVEQIYRAVKINRGEPYHR